MFIDVFVDMFVDNNSQMNVIEAKKSLFRGHMTPSLMFIAVANGHLKTVQLLLDKGAEVDQFSGPAGDLLQSNSRGAANFPNLETYGNDLLQALLCAAAVRGYDDIVAVLLSASTTLEGPPSLDQCPLYQAAKVGHSKVVSVLLEAGVDPRPSLLAHINSKNHQIVRRLVEAALNLTSSESWGPYDTEEARENSYLITIATRCGKTEIVRYLLAAGAKTADKDKDGMSALLWAIQCGHDEIVKLLLNYRALFKADESQRVRALDLACRSRQANLVLMLLARHSREWTETTDERVNAIVRMEVRRRREEMES
ncbi:ankyrin [Hyaloscypha bicolor E]|uniref:Ankyrin n=1 Tax=Hyaloscypha bicolor E TaxID=1095630 RepID=A0A2J6T6M7_9HELO|nr:ankyrin [Hyaloscypha bicolor E]PMD58667.1 ankyrin [Hyaloscypha bicolor E]